MFSPSLARLSSRRPLALSARSLGLVGLASLLALAAPAFADDAASPPPASPTASATSTSPATATAPAASDDYRVGPGDVLSVAVALSPDLSGGALVLPDGSVSLPRIGRVQVGDRTLSEVRSLLHDAFLRILKDPQVSVGISQPRPSDRQVFVFGSVNKPGPVDLPADPRKTWRVAEALAAAGGLKQPPALVTLVVATKAGGMKTFPAETILNAPDGPDDVALAPGDAVSAQEIPPQPIFVSGAVARPAMYDLREIDPKRGWIGALEALTLAGGPSANAALSQAYVLRAAKGESSASERTKERVDLTKLESARKGGSPDALRLRPGDTLYVPASTAKIVVMGKVKMPGLYPISEDRTTTVAEAIAMAGGPVERAKMSEVGIVRASSEGEAPAADLSGGKPTLLKVDMSGLRKGDLRQNAALKAGDVVVVPETGHPDWFGKIVPSALSLAQIFYLGNRAGL
jgi:polysaccharide export outer membrane protein